MIHEGWYLWQWAEDEKEIMGSVRWAAFLGLERRKCADLEMSRSYGADHDWS